MWLVAYRSPQMRMTLKETLLRLRSSGAPLALALILVIAAAFVLMSPAPHALAAPGPSAPVSSAFAPDLTIDHRQAISRALAFLATKQLPTGGIEGWTPGQPDEYATAHTLIALAAAGLPPTYLTTGGQTPFTWLSARAMTYTHDADGLLFPSRAGVVILGVVAANGEPRNIAGLNLVNELHVAYQPATGAYSTTAQLGFSSGAASAAGQSWAILGLAAAQESIPITASTFLISLQESDGGWGYGFGGDVDTTALVVQALIASGHVPPDHHVIQQALAFLRSVQTPSGGWQSWGFPSAESTAAAIQAVVAAGYTPATVSWASASGLTPHHELAALQAADGSFGGNALGTALAIPGLTETPLPILGHGGRARRALTWLVSQQNPDGSWPGWAGSDPGATADAVLAFASAGFDPATVVAPGTGLSAMDYLSNTARTYSQRSPDQTGKLALTVAAAGRDPRSFGGIDMVATLSTFYSSTLGAFGVPTNTWHQALPILGLRAAGEAVPAEAVQTLLSLQQSDGGWQYDLATSPWNTTSADSTGLALQALIAGGIPPTHTSIVSGVAFLRTLQEDSGAWADANATAYAMQGLLATGEDLTNAWTRNGHTPYDGLASFQKSDGSFVWLWGWPVDSGLATGQAVVALLGVHYPYTPGTLRPFEPVHTGPDPDRLVTVRPRLTVTSDTLRVILPFGSDRNRNAAADVTWRLNGGTWRSLSPRHMDDYCLAEDTLPYRWPGLYEVRVAFSDPDGIQGPAVYTVSQTVAGQTLYLPLILSNKTH